MSKYINMMHRLTFPERYRGNTIKDIMQADPLYIGELIDTGIFNASPNALRVLQTHIDGKLGDITVIDDPDAY